jgi:hypothetical protein
MLFFPSCLRACSAPARGEASGLVQDERYSSRYSERCAGSVCFAVPAAASLYAIRSSSADLQYAVQTVLERLTTDTRAHCAPRYSRLGSTQWLPPALSGSTPS